MYIDRFAKNPDGSSITGPSTEEFVIDKAATQASQRLTYPAASAEKSKASLTVRRTYAGTPVPVPSTDWDYVDAKLNAVKLTSGNFGAPGSFGPTALYEFTYVAKDPAVASLGLAAIRDIATYLRNAETDDKGAPNPLAGDVAFIYSFCSSQPCRTMHDYVQLGFNQPELAAGAAPLVFDGILARANGQLRLRAEVREHEARSNLKLEPDEQPPEIQPKCEPVLASDKLRHWDWERSYATRRDETTRSLFAYANIVGDRDDVLRLWPPAEMTVRAETPETAVAKPVGVSSRSQGDGVIRSRSKWQVVARQMANHIANFVASGRPR
jgi:hypothetical protein